MDSKIERELRFLKAYAYTSALAFGVLIFVAAKGPGSAKFTEIDAERINIREKDGHLRLAIANTDRMPGGTIAGVDLSYRDGKRDGAGMIFFNDEGDEDGGLVYSGKMVDGKPVAGGTIRFDNYRQNEAIGMSHSQEGDYKESAFEVWDQPNVPLTADLVRGLVKVQTMSDGQPKKDAMQALLKEHGTENGALHGTRVRRPHEARRRGRPPHGHEGEASHSDGGGLLERRHARVSGREREGAV